MQYEEVPTQQIIDKLRQTLEPRIVADSPQSGSKDSTIALEQEDEDIALLKTGFDIYNVPITSYQRRLGSVVQTGTGTTSNLQFCQYPRRSNIEQPVAKIAGESKKARSKTARGI